MCMYLLAKAFQDHAQTLVLYLTMEAISLFRCPNNSQR